MPRCHGRTLATGAGGQVSLATAIRPARFHAEDGSRCNHRDHDATITNPNNAMFRVDNFVDVERDVSSLFAEWQATGEHGDIEIGLRAKRVAAMPAKSAAAA